MPKKYETYIVSFKDSDGWRGTGIESPVPLWANGDTLSIGKQILSQDSLINDSRVRDIHSQIGHTLKPSGAVSFVPDRLDLKNVLYSHFQSGTELGTVYSYYAANGIGTKYTFYPNKYNIVYDGGTFQGGTYGHGSSSAFSMSFLKQFRDINGTNCIMFQNGICNSLEMSMQGNSDFNVKADYKFRDAVIGTKIIANPPDSSLGSYSRFSHFQGFHGTFTVGGDNIRLTGLITRFNNNLVEKTPLGRLNPDNFVMGDFEAGGNFAMDFPDDGFEQYGSMLGTKEFSLSGTMFKEDVDGTGGTRGLYLIINMPYCIRQPFDAVLQNDWMVQNIPFKAFGSAGNSPVEIILQDVYEPPAIEDLIIETGTSSDIIIESGTHTDIIVESGQP